MENYELKRHQKSDVIKWIIAFALIFVLLAGLIGTWVVLFEDDAPEEESPAQTETVVTDGEGNPMESGKVYAMPANMVFAKVYAMPANMVFAATAAEPSDAKDGITLKATIDPDTAANQNVDWSVSFVNPSSSWASGKTVTDYVTVTPISDGALTATVQCLKAFGEQIKITVTSRANEYATAECTVDYARRITDFTFYSFPDNQQAPGFGKDEILVDMVIPSADDLFSSEEVVVTELKSVVLFAAGDPEVEGFDIYDEDIARTYQFSDYTIKDCKIATDLENSDGLGATVEITWEYNRDFGNLLSACASLLHNNELVFSTAELDPEGTICNNPVAWVANMVGVRSFDADIYKQAMDLFVEWLQENPDEPILTFHLQVTGKYSTFKKDIKVRYNPVTVEMPVFGVRLDQGSLIV